MGTDTKKHMTEREKRLANLIGRYLEINGHTCAGCFGDECGVGSAHETLVEDMREALSDEGSGGGNSTERRGGPLRYSTCPSCEGSGLRLNHAGEPDECVDCGGNTVVHDDTSPERGKDDG